MRTTLFSKILVGASFIISTMTISMTTTAATLKGTETLNVVSINGQAIKTIKPVQLPEGKVLVEVRYQDLFSYRADDNGTWIKSEPLFFILDVATQSDYQISTPELASEADAKRFINNPRIQLSVDGTTPQLLALQNNRQLMAGLLLSHAAK
ncbi:DUF2057 family protein [Shewanella oneidensis MR-1]|uniref:DUF2057 domain-containing protein n=1 Tax=Shewanella oneidensis (strain ATCC 700550 / JCM 31522 / CIP 106686 / LMG 19005 / NCIMB 14063 / MR-1) TaxID=211586 RepID=Q8E8R8_SHEON|nr:DUF2057 family protein [Shewanella oneidensis]AAN57553.1 periplasmic protein of unknown function DUF2057 [Shewanella oneidensis MR-1]MDX5998163.1 DUF2057 family protein [Shewanella oneidensis]MEE2026774.1 hypothetical protein [Shewanella oneidensis]QKG94846.1 DUF2057 family protein [Shewanella oneidensis MR-1]